MYRCAALLVCVVTLFGAGCSSKQMKASPTEALGPSTPPSAPVTPGVEDDFESRKNVVEQWYAAAEKVAERAGSSDAKETLKLITDVSLVAKPVGNFGLAFLNPEKAPIDPQRVIGLLPLLETDRSIPGNYQVIAQEQAFAYFDRDNRVIVFPAWVKTTEAWRGIVFLHEAWHARDLINLGNYTEDSVLVTRELRAHTFENALIRGIGGAAYTKFVSEQVSGLVDSEPQTWREPAVGDYADELTDIFGPAESGLEKKLRNAAVWFDVAFTAIDRKFDEAAENQKLEFLRAHYVRAGLIQPRQ